MKIYFKSGNNVRITKIQAELLIEKIFNESDKNQHLKISEEGKPIAIFKVSEIEAVY